ncbi:MAG: YwaF family protein [Clostridia bacterium]|nr:YwaF family protein [Clostridia bacterium]
MFYLIFSVVFAVILGTYLLLRYKFFKNNEKFNHIMDKTIKISTIVFCATMLLSILLPDAFTLERSQEFLGAGKFQGYAILRWLMATPFVVYPIAVYSKNRTFRNIAIYFCTIVTIVSIAFYSTHMQFFTSTEGRGLNSLSIAGAGFKKFMINTTFRSIIFAFTMMLQLLIPILLAFQEKHIFDVKNKKEWGLFFGVLPLIIISSIPIYVPQYLFGHSNLILKPFGYLHFLWIALAVGELVALYFIFRKKDKQVQKILLFTLALSLFQYNQMFGAISLNFKRLPFQLCNIGAYLIVISLVTMNRKLFNFTAIVNVVGVLFALAMPDLEGKGLFYLYNMHFILEHTNVLIVPVLALMFGIFPRLDKSALKHCIVGFVIYFLSVWALGTAFNAIALATGNGFYSANYLFMFSAKDAVELLPFTQALFDINFKIGYATFYPVIQLIVFVVFLLVCILLYFVIRLIYKIKDKTIKTQKPLA